MGGGRDEFGFHLVNLLFDCHIPQGGYEPGLPFLGIQNGRSAGLDETVAAFSRNQPVDYMWLDVSFTLVGQGKGQFLAQRDVADDPFQWLVQNFPAGGGE